MMTALWKYYTVTGADSNTCTAPELDVVVVVSVPPPPLLVVVTMKTAFFVVKTLLTTSENTHNFT
jgi:hypothetical protein